MSKSETKGLQNKNVFKEGKAEIVGIKKKATLWLLFSLAEQFKGVCVKHWNVLTSDIQRIQHLYREPPPLPRVVVFKRGHNLGDLWTASNLPPAPAQIVLVPVPHGNHKYGACTQRNSTKWSRYLHHPHSGEKIPVSGVVSCATAFVVCLLLCTCEKRDALAKPNSKWNREWLSSVVQPAVKM